MFRLFRFFFLFFFPCLSFFSFSHLLAAVIDLLLGLLIQVKKFWEDIIKTGKFCHGVATCSHKQICSEFFTQISEHFHWYFRLHWANHSDLGIIGNIVFLLQNFNADDVTFGRGWWCQKWNKAQCSLRPVMPATGVNGLTIIKREYFIWKCN